MILCPDEVVLVKVKTANREIVLPTHESPKIEVITGLGPLWHIKAVNY